MRHKANHRQIGFFFTNFSPHTGHLPGMADPFEIRTKILFHLHRHPIFQQIFLLGQTLPVMYSRHCSAYLQYAAHPEIHWIHNFLMAMTASPGGIIP